MFNVFQVGNVIALGEQLRTQRSVVVLQRDHDLATTNPQGMSNLAQVATVLLQDLVCHRAVTAEEEFHSSMVLVLDEALVDGVERDGVASRVLEDLTQEEGVVDEKAFLEEKKARSVLLPRLLFLMGSSVQEIKVLEFAEARGKQSRRVMRINGL